MMKRTNRYLYAALALLLGLAYVLRATAGFAGIVDLAFTHQLAKVRVVTKGAVVPENIFDVFRGEEWYCVWKMGRIIQSMT